VELHDNFCCRTNGLFHDNAREGGGGFGLTNGDKPLDAREGTRARVQVRWSISERRKEAPVFCFLKRETARQTPFSSLIQRLKFRSWLLRNSSTSIHQSQSGKHTHTHIKKKNKNRMKERNLGS